MPGGFEFGIAPLQGGELGFQVRELAAQRRVFIGQFGGAQPSGTRLRQIGQARVEAQRHRRIALVGPRVFSGQYQVRGVLLRRGLRVSRGPCGGVRRPREGNGRAMGKPVSGTPGRGATGCDGGGRQSGLRVRGGSVLVERDVHRHGWVEQYDILALQAHLAVRNQHELYDRIVHRGGRADEQACLASCALDVHFCAERRRDAVCTCAEAEAIRRRIGGRAEQGDGRVQGAAQWRMHGDVAHAQGRGGAGLTQTEKQPNGFEVHAVGKQ